MPLALATGVKTSLPALMSAMLMLWPTVTAAPPSVRLPAVGRLDMVTAIKALAGLSFASLNPKSVAAKTQAVSSLVVSVALEPDGASLTGVRLKVIVFAVGSRSTPPLVVPPLS